MGKNFFKKAVQKTLTEKHIKSIEKTYKEKEIQELKENIDDLLCYVCNTNKPTINEKLGVLDPCEDCKKIVTRTRKYKKFSIFQFAKLFKRQEERCAICNEPLKKTYIDHCHLKEHVRGILCGSCNMGLGMFKDNPNVLLSAYKYLKTNENSAKWCVQQEKPLLEKNFLKNGYIVDDKLVSVGSNALRSLID